MTVMPWRESEPIGESRSPLARLRRAAFLVWPEAGHLEADLSRRTRLVVAVALLVIGERRAIGLWLPRQLRVRV